MLMSPSPVTSHFLSGALLCHVAAPSVSPHSPLPLQAGGLPSPSLPAVRTMGTRLPVLTPVFGTTGPVPGDLIPWVTGFPRGQQPPVTQEETEAAEGETCLGG